MYSHLLSYRDRIVSVFLFFVLGLLLFNQNISAQEIVLADSGIANYYIYYDLNESMVVEHAALELGQKLDELSGADFPVLNSPDTTKRLIVVGRNNPLTQSISGLMEFDSIKTDGFKILVHNNNLYIAGAIDRGTLYGVYYLLDNYFGFRWFSPEYDMVPHYSKLALNQINDLQNPHFEYREIFSEDTEDAYFRQHNRLNGNRGGTHREYNDYPEEIDDWSKAGPRDGHNFHDIVGAVYHYGGQIETMNDAVRAQAASYFISRISDDGDEPWYNFSQEDNGWEPDEESLAFAEAHGNALSAPIVDMVIDIANRVRATHPNAHLATDAYQWSFKPPTNMTVPEYVMIEAAPIEANFGYPFNDSDNNYEAYHAFTGWDDIASTLGIWTYNTNFQNYLQPMPNIYPMFENIKYLAGLKSVKSYFGQGAYNTFGANFAELKGWVAARLLWNPDQDYKALVNEFCDGYYGPASTYIKQYLDLLHNSFKNSGERLSVKQRINSEYLNLDFILQADQLMAAADAIATGDYAEHVHEVRLGVDMTILLREHLYDAEAQERGIEWQHDPNRRQRFNQYAEEARVTNYSEDAEIDMLFNAMDIDRINPPKPDFIKEGMEWIDYQDLDFTFCCGANMVEDSLASDHGAIEYGGVEWAVSMKLDLLPPGIDWKLYAYVRVDVNPNADPEGEAFNLGVYPGSWITPTIAEVQDGQYHLYEFPDMPVRYQTGSDVWFSAGSPDVKNFYVDRIIAVNVLTGVKHEILKPQKFSLFQNYPNPFNPTTTIKYDIPGDVKRETKNVKLIVYDVLGREVAMLVNEKQAPGNYEVTFDASGLPSGIYFYKLTAGSFSDVKKMILMK